MARPLTTRKVGSIPAHLSAWGLERAQGLEPSTLTLAMVSSDQPEAAVVGWEPQQRATDGSNRDQRSQRGTSEGHEDDH